MPADDIFRPYICIFNKLVGYGVHSLASLQEEGFLWM